MASSTVGNFFGYRAAEELILGLGFHWGSDIIDEFIIVLGQFTRVRRWVARWLSLGVSRILGLEGISIESIVIGHEIVAAFAILQNQIADVRVNKLRAFALQQTDTTLVDGTARVGALALSSQRGDISVHFLARVATHSSQFLLRVLLRLDIATLSSRCKLQFLVLALDKLVLHRKFVLSAHAAMRVKVYHAELDVFLCLSEAERSRDLVVKVDFFPVENENVATSDYITSRVH
mmetsp:Transcript_47702/g.63022  ORF Transcript_47702/g.63022 Transcript_47702/m.63022 type:complete len:234 (-) Transcript_47702:547-1248(-)